MMKVVIVKTTIENNNNILLDNYNINITRIIKILIKLNDIINNLIN